MFAAAVDPAVFDRTPLFAVKDRLLNDWQVFC